MSQPITFNLLGVKFTLRTHREDGRVQDTHPFDLEAAGWTTKAKAKRLQDIIGALAEGTPPSVAAIEAKFGEEAARDFIEAMHFAGKQDLIKKEPT